MNEIEAKFKVSDTDCTRLRQIIQKMNATPMGSKTQIDTYFKHSKKDSLKNKPTYLRVRTVNGKSATAMHYKLEKYNWEEIETPVEDGDKIRTIYKNLGFDIDVEVTKNRETFKIPEGEIVIDSIKNVGKFIEIEVTSKEKLAEYCKKLGFDVNQENELENKSYADLVREHKNSSIT